MKYTEVDFKLKPYNEDICDALIAALGGIGFDGFAGTGEGFLAYIPSKDYNQQAIWDLPYMQLFGQDHEIVATAREMEDRDWNKEWEESFTPVIVDGTIQVRAGFHPSQPGIRYDIIIEPKMSFGTGHHPTTAIMLRSILQEAPAIAGKRVLDMGCGTGILSIMAAKVGAREITGIDIDDWAYNNAMENIRNNGMDNITIRIGDASLLEREAGFGVILANINRNILLRDMEYYDARLERGGLLILSGFYLKDLPMIREKAEGLGLSFIRYNEEKQWVAASFRKE